MQMTELRYAIYNLTGLMLAVQQVKYVDDTGLAYVMQRYREVHDLVHVMNGMGIGYAISTCFIPSIMLKTDF